MTCIIDTKSKRRLPARLAAGFAICALLVLGTYVASASAQDHHGGHRGGDERGGRGYGYGGYGGYDEDRGYGGWGGGYYPPPPVVYASPYAYPPPVIYGPGIGIEMPGINIGIR